MIKIIELSYMVNGLDCKNKPCKTLEEQAQDLFIKNPEYEYIDFIYKPNDNVINMRYATLFVNAKK